MFLRDPTDVNVVPIVEELRRRLPPANIFRQAQGDGKEHLSGHNDVEAGEEDGISYLEIVSFIHIKNSFKKAAFIFIEKGK